MTLTRQRDPDEPSEPIAGTTVWHDYDGDSIYGDVAILGVAGSPPQFVMAETFSHEPGVGQFDVEQTALSFYHGDQIGSLRAVTGDESGNPPAPSVEGRIVYTAFGEPVYVGSVGVPPAGVGTRYQYAGAYGYQSDLYSAAGPHSAGSPGDFANAIPFVHVGHRWYDPSTGRFLQRDPIGVDGGLNVYEYAISRPTGKVDPTGLIGSLMRPDGIVALIECEIALGGGATTVKWGPQVYQVTCTMIQRLGDKTIVTLKLVGDKTVEFAYFGTGPQMNVIRNTGHGLIVQPPSSGGCGLTGLEVVPFFWFVARRRMVKCIANRHEQLAS